jgi:alanine dehydrogenase
MQIGIAKETWPGEVRAAMVPGNAKKAHKARFQGDY